jgi:hypothetical protein
MQQVITAVPLKLEVYLDAALRCVALRCVVSSDE